MKEIIDIPLKDIAPHPDNRRIGGFNQEKLEQLAESIRDIGVQQPAIVSPGSNGTHRGGLRIMQTSWARSKQMTDPMTADEIRASCQALLDNCNGHPHARIPWPHRVLHEAVGVCDTALHYIERCTELEHEMERLKTNMMLGPEAGGSDE